MEPGEKNDNKTPYSEKIEKANWREKMYAEIAEELKNNPRVEQLKEKYSLSSVDNFIRNYASEKVDILEWGPSYIQWHEQEDLEWVEKAMECLEEIQQKKLFDMQCMWRAGKIDLEGVLICHDFSMLEKDVMNCKLIPSITLDEIDLYIQYLQSNNWEEPRYSIDHPQDYEGIKEAYNSDGEYQKFPEWYDFYNGRKGTGVYMLFPDYRGEMEEFYSKLYREANKEKINKEREQQKHTQHKVDTRPYIHTYTPGVLRWFVETFEDKQTLEFAELANGFREFGDFDFEWTFDKDLLSKTEVPVPVEAWHDWKEALHRSAEWYRRMKIAEAMPLAYDEYCMRQETGIPFEKSDRDRDFEAWIEKYRKDEIEKIIQGRILNGEPPDLNY